MLTKNTLDEAAPRFIGRYELIAPVLSGALGELWQARIASGPEEGRAVLIRRIRRSEGMEMRYVERLTNAGFAAMELRHPRIAAVLDVVVGAAEIAIVSEHIAGAVLQTLVRPEPGKRVSVPIGVASRVALDLLEAIDAVRAPWAELFDAAESSEDQLLRSCVHGGLLPDGLLVASFGETMLLEAGLAGVALTIPSILDHPDVIAYRAPEQLEPGRPIDERADVFTIGILFWEMIAGRFLFGPSVLPRPAAGAASKEPAVSDPVQVSAARRKVLAHPVPRLDALPLLKGKVPKELADVVAGCLERDPALRFQTARDAIRALAVLDGEYLSRHDGVVKLVSALGIRGLSAAPPAEVEQEGPSSNRPTAPPIDEPTARSPTDVSGEGVTRPGSELLHPAVRDPDTEKSRDAAPPSSSDIESVPPSTEELDTLPPLEAVQVAMTQLGDVEGSVTLMSGAVPPERAPLPPAIAAPLRKPEETQHEETTSAPVVRPLDLVAATPRSDMERDGEDPVFSERRDRSRKLVVGIMAGAAVIVLIAILRAALSQGGGAPASGTPPSAASGVATQAVASALPVTEPAPNPANSAEAALVAEGSQQPAQAPTSEPPVANPPPAETTTHKAGVGTASSSGTKKRPFRPSGI